MNARSAAAVVLRHCETEFDFDLPPEGQMEIGRSDPMSGYQPEIDLTGLDPEQGISRRHAVIEKVEDGWCLYEEKGTLNGTFLNERQLRRGHRYLVTVGDRIRFSAIEFELVAK